MKREGVLHCQAVIEAVLALRGVAILRRFDVFEKCDAASFCVATVSYTHLTLPTIYSV